MASEHSCYTWDPVSRAWVHERGPEIPPPPAPPDIHALQSYFFDDDSKQWIRTVLAPMGRELAAKWEGAHKIPDDATGQGLAPTKGARKQGSSAVGVIFTAVMLLVMLGGAGVVASQNGLLTQVPTGVAIPNVAIPIVHDSTPLPSADAATSPSPSPSPSPTPVPTTVTGGGGGGGGGVVRTNPPVATIAIPAGPSTKLADGTTAVYTGPTLAVKPAPLTATLTFVAASGRPATGDVTVVLGPMSVPALIDANGRVAVTFLTATIAPGQYPLQLISKGALSSPVAFITVR